MKFELPQEKLNAEPSMKLLTNDEAEASRLLRDIADANSRQRSIRRLGEAYIALSNYQFMHSLQTWQTISVLYKCTK